MSKVAMTQKWMILNMMLSIANPKNGPIFFEQIKIHYFRSLVEDVK
jgi:hypothetical protein